MGLFECFSSHGVWKDKRRGSSGGGKREIPDDIIIDILSRLPAECVLKHRRVCKRWLALTCTSHFAQLHLKRSATALLLQISCCRQSDDKLNLFQLGENNTTTTSGTKKKDNNNPLTLKRIIRGDVVITERVSDLRIRASCDGFLLFQDVRCNSRFVVCNIVTREQVTLDPPINNPSCDSSVNAMFLHPVTKEYTMLFQNTALGTLPYFIHNDFYFYLYGVTSKMWRQISSFHHIPKYVCPPVVLNNTLHWMTGRRSSGGFFLEENSHCDSAIFMFDTITEEFRVMPHPGNTCASLVEFHQNNMFIYEAEGTLCLYWIQPSEGVADIWALEDYDNWCWAKKKTIVNAYINQMSPISTRLIYNQELVFQSGTRFYKVNIDENHQQPEILVDEMRKEFKRKIISHIAIFPITKSFVSLKPSKDDQIQLSIHPSPEEN